MGISGYGGTTIITIDMTPDQLRELDKEYGLTYSETGEGVDTAIIDDSPKDFKRLPEELKNKISEYINTNNYPRNAYQELTDFVKGLHPDMLHLFVSR